MREGEAGFTGGLIIGATIFSFIVPGACTHARKEHARAALGCTVITAEDAGVRSDDSTAVYWRCKDGKVYMR